MAFVQATALLRTANSSGDPSLATLNSVGAGNTLFVVPTNYPSGFTGVSSSPSLTWQRAVLVGDGGNNFAEIWFAPVVSGGNYTVTVDPTSANGNYVTAVAMEHSGMDNAALLDRSGTAAGSFTVSTSQATQQADELLIAVSVADDAANPISWGTPSGFTLLAKEDDSNTYTGMIAAFRTVSATGVQSAVFSASGLSGSQVDCAIATFRLASGSTNVDLAGAALGGASAAAALSKSVALSGSATGGASASANLTKQVPLAGASVSSSLAGGQLSLTVNLSGGAFVASLAAAQMAHGVPLSGSAGAGGLAAGVLSLQVNLNGAATASLQASASADKHVALDGGASGGAAAAGSLLGDAALSGSAVAGGSGGGTLSLHVPLTAQAVANSLATGQLSVHINLGVGAVAQALAGGALTVTANVLLLGAATGGASGTAALDGTTPPRIARVFFGERRRSMVFGQEQRSAAFSHKQRRMTFRQD